LLSAAGAVLLLGETLSWVGVAGVSLVAAGVFLIAGGPRLRRALNGVDAERQHRVRLGVAYGAATGVSISAYTVLDAYAVTVLAMSPILFDYAANLLRIPFVLPAALCDPRATRALWRRTWRWALVVALLSPLSYVMVLYALRLAPLSHVAPAREVSMLFAALLGGRLLGEGDPGLRLAGAACMAAGVAALAIG
jgi:drug/metabolite transporter (DMT)-like permease